MKRTVLPLLLLLFCFYSCSENPKPGASKGGGNGSSTDVVEIAADYIDSLRQQVNDLHDVSDIKALLCQQWEHAEDKKEAETYGGSSSFTMVYRGMAFFNDGTVVTNPRSFISFGTWQYSDDDKIILINLDNGDRYRYKIKAVAANELLLDDLDDGQSKTEKYVAQAFAYKKNERDPFYVANNQWRIKPTQSETLAQINKRVKDCVRFYGLFYNDNLVRDTSIISFVGLPSCFNWYNSGIGVQTADKLSDEWKGCFYNMEQALQAHAILEKLITKKYHWTKGPFDWRVKTAKVLQQMNAYAAQLLP